MVYRTRTYIAADWDGDKDAINQLVKWNESNYWSLSYIDAHELTQARDDSLNCSIKKSLAKRLDASKTFVLIVGSNTKYIRAGGCRYCASYNANLSWCQRGYLIDHRSYIEFECEKAAKDEMKIVVLYNSSTVDRSKCLEVLRNTGTHTAMQCRNEGKLYWNYQAVYKALVD